MEAFEPKDFEYPIKKPSFDSVVRQKRREQAQKAEQEQYAVVNTEQKEDAPEPLYTEMEQKMMDEAANLSLVGHLSELRRRIIIMVVAICEPSIDSSRETSIKLDFTSSLFVVCNRYFLFLYLSVACCG